MTLVLSNFSMDDSLLWSHPLCVLGGALGLGAETLPLTLPPWGEHLPSPS